MTHAFTTYHWIFKTETACSNISVSYETLSAKCFTYRTPFRYSPDQTGCPPLEIGERGLSLLLWFWNDNKCQEHYHAWLIQTTAYVYTNKTAPTWLIICLLKANLMPSHVCAFRRFYFRFDHSRVNSGSVLPYAFDSVPNFIFHGAFLSILSVFTNKVAITSRMLADFQVNINISPLIIDWFSGWRHLFNWKPPGFHLVKDN